MSPEAKKQIEKQLILPDVGFEPIPLVVSASRRTELVALRPDWLVNALERFPSRYKRDIHSVVLWTKDPRNIIEHNKLRDELAKHNLVVNCTITGLGGTRIEPTVPVPNVLLERIPHLLEFLGNPKRFRWRFDPIVTLKKDHGTHWSSIVYFEQLANEMAMFGIDNCYFSFCHIYKEKFKKRDLEEAGINLIVPTLKEQRDVVETMKTIAKPLGITLYSCAQPLIENEEGVIPAKCIDAELLVELHPNKNPADARRDKTQSKYRAACYCTQSVDIGSYLPCGHGCVYCYAEAAVPSPEKLLKKPQPFEL